MKKILLVALCKSWTSLKILTTDKGMLRLVGAVLVFSQVSFTSNAQFGTSPWTAPNGTYTVPVGVTSITVQCQGGGGGGGGVRNTSCSWREGGGGGGGAYSNVTSFAVTPGQTITVVNGAGGSAGSSSGSAGGTGGTSSVVYNVGSVTVCSAAGGNGGGGCAGSTEGCVGTGGAGGSTGVGITYTGGNGSSACNPYCGSGSGGGGACDIGNGTNASGLLAGGSCFGTLTGGSGGAGVKVSSDGYANGKAGSAPGGGGGGAMDVAFTNCGSAGGASGGAGGAGSVTISYTLNPICSAPCIGWINQSCTICTSGCYVDAGAVVPTRSIQTASTTVGTSNYGYLFWTFNAVADSTYYFDLCSSTGTAGVSWLRLHNARNTSPNNNYCMDALSTQTEILQNMQNGCTGTGIGLSKLIWTCRTSGTYYLESAVGSNMSPWGSGSTQTAILTYKTLPSFSYVCNDVFYDKGIDGISGSTSGYNNNEDWIYTYYPLDTITSAISAQFVSFSTAPGDVLCVYDGNSVNAPVIGCFAGPSITGSFSSTASNGSLTFQFSSSDSAVSSGWEANISCISNVGVQNNGSLKNISLFPNPVKDQLEISGINLKANTIINIFDIVGKNVNTIQLGLESTAKNSNQKTIVNVNDLPSGVYFIQAENESGTWNGRFIKQ